MGMLVCVSPAVAAPSVTCEDWREITSIGGEPEEGAVFVGVPRLREFEQVELAHSTFSASELDEWRAALDRKPPREECSLVGFQQLPNGRYAVTASTYGSGPISDWLIDFGAVENLSTVHNFFDDLNGGESIVIQANRSEALVPDAVSQLGLSSFSELEAVIDRFPDQWEVRQTNDGSFSWGSIGSVTYPLPEERELRLDDIIDLIAIEPDEGSDAQTLTVVLRAKADRPFVATRLDSEILERSQCFLNHWFPDTPQDAVVALNRPTWDGMRIDIDLARLEAVERREVWENLDLSFSVQPPSNDGRRAQSDAIGISVSYSGEYLERGYFDRPLVGFVLGREPDSSEIITPITPQIADLDTYSSNFAHCLVEFWIRSDIAQPCRPGASLRRRDREALQSTPPPIDC